MTNRRSPVVAPKRAEPPYWDLNQIVEELRQARERWRSAYLRNHECGGREFPSRQRLR
jgi:serine O-acetyltransferase